MEKVWAFPHPYPVVYNHSMDEMEWTAAHRRMISITAYCCAREHRRRLTRQEPLIAFDPQIAYLYALKVMKGRFFEAEDSISRSPEWAVRYARFVIRGRFAKAERFIARSPRWCYEYADKVVKGRLPPRMHKMMAESNDRFARKYMEGALGRKPDKH